MGQGKFWADWGIGSIIPPHTPEPTRCHEQSPFGGKHAGREPRGSSGCRIFLRPGHSCAHRRRRGTRSPVRPVPAPTAEVGARAAPGIGPVEAQNPGPRAGGPLSGRPALELVRAPTRGRLPGVRSPDAPQPDPRRNPPQPHARSDRHPGHRTAGDRTFPLEEAIGQQALEQYEAAMERLRPEIAKPSSPVSKWASSIRRSPRRSGSRAFRRRTWRSAARW